jgi:hypothetical protein
MRAALVDALKEVETMHNKVRHNDTSSRFLAPCSSTLSPPICNHIVLTLRIFAHNLQILESSVVGGGPNSAQAEATHDVGRSLLQPLRRKSLS